MKKLIYVCSPYSGDDDFGKAALHSICRFCLRQDVIPVSPSLYFSLLMDPRSRHSRDHAAAASIELMKRCDEVWVFGEESTFAMAREITHAEMDNLKIRHFAREAR